MYFNYQIARFLLVSFCWVCLPFYAYVQVNTQTYSTVGKETFVVPTCVNTIRMEVVGAEGAEGASVNEPGGTGQQITSTFSVSPGDRLEIVVGGAGNGSLGLSGGGGGGSGVFNLTTSQLLIIAGGGGGGGGGGGVGRGGNSVNTFFIATCVSPDSVSCGGMDFGSGGGGGGGGYGGDGGVYSGSIGSPSGFGGTGGFGAAGGIGGNGTDSFGGYGAGGGGGGSGLCSGGGGGGGYKGGKAGSGDESIEGGGSGGSGFVNGTSFTEISGMQVTSTSQNGRVILSYTMNSPPTVSATATNGDLITLQANFTAVVPSTQAVSWSWSGPNNFTSTSKNPTPFTASANTVGDYTVTVTDNNGCTNTDTASIASFRAGIPRIPTLSEWGLLIYGLFIMNLSVLFLLRVTRIRENLSS